MPKRPDNKMEQLLHRLNTADAGAAWAEFIDRYAPLIMHAVQQFEFEQDRANDCFLFVCEGLCDDGFKRLLKFNTRGRARFSTWLGTVVYHLCVDWHRKEYGRAQMLPAINALPQFDQAVFRLYFEQSLDREACLQTLQDEFPDLSRQQFSDAIARVYRVLTPRQRWQLSLRQHRRAARNGPDLDVEHLPADLPTAEAESAAEQRREQLGRAMAKLDPEQRLILHLRFVEGLTLEKIAAAMHLGDPFRARRQVNQALAALSGRLPEAARGKKS